MTFRITYTVVSAPPLLLVIEEAPNVSIIDLGRLVQTEVPRIILGLFSPYTADRLGALSRDGHLTIAQTFVEGRTTAKPRWPPVGRWAQTLICPSSVFSHLDFQAPRGFSLIQYPLLEILILSFEEIAHATTSFSITEKQVCPDRRPQSAHRSGNMAVLEVAVYSMYLYSVPRPRPRQQ